MLDLDHVVMIRGVELTITTCTLSTRGIAIIRREIWRVGFNNTFITLIVVCVQQFSPKATMCLPISKETSFQFIRDFLVPKGAVVFEC
jgi:hypothetical protein